MEAFGWLEEPRAARGVRRPFAGMVVLTLLGMLARIREMEVLVRWATANGARLREPRGFDRDEPPCATTFRRTLAKCRVADFQAVFTVWLQARLAEATTRGAAAVDGKALRSTLWSTASPHAPQRPPAAETTKTRGLSGNPAVLGRNPWRVENGLHFSKDRGLKLLNS